MNTLTPNRILQKDDEYRDNGTWKPVPSNDYGLQIQFTDYKEVRRPSEKPFPVPVLAEPVRTHSDRKDSVTANDEARESTKILPKGTDSRGGETISPEQEGIPARAESEKTPVPTHSPYQPPQGGIEYLPTIVSKKAHANSAQEITSRNLAKVTALRETPETVKKEPTEVAKSPASLTPSTYIKIKYKDITHDHPDRPIWTGRNGTFTGYGLEAIMVNKNVMLSPLGKRGVGNCTIQVPVASIPDLIDFLQKQL